MRNYDKGYLLILAIVGFVTLLYLLGNGAFSSVVGPVTLSAQNSLYPVPTSFSIDSVSSSKSHFTRKSRRQRNIELNSADSATLVTVYGIGPTFARRIIERRKKLGGYYCVEQLQEVRGVDKEVYGRVARNFFVDPALITKISINFAAHQQLMSHPYIDFSMAKRIDKARTKGGYFTGLEELISRNILLPNEAQKVAPYLLFESKQTENNNKK